MLFVGFFYVRKLIESRFVTDACARSAVRIERGRITRTHEVSDFSRDELEKDLQGIEWMESKVDVHQLADKVVHAWWVLPLQGTRGGLDGYILTTDRQRNTELWSLPITSVIEVYESFSSNDVRNLSMRRNEKGQLTYWSAT